MAPFRLSGPGQGSSARSGIWPWVCSRALRRASSGSSDSRLGSGKGASPALPGVGFREERSPLSLGRLPLPNALAVHGAPGPSRCPDTVGLDRAFICSESPPSLHSQRHRWD